MASQINLWYVWGIYMINAFFVILFAAALAAIALGVRYTLHMFQQSSYQYRSYWRYMKTHPVKTLLPFTGVVLLLGSLAAGKSLAAVMVLLALELCYMILLILLYWPRAAKKKLVITARVKRLIATTAVLYVLICLLVLLVTKSFWWPLFWLAALGALLSPYMVLLANLLNRPIEKGINQYYIR
ncbi:MAG: hypothetical protein K2H45_03550, partial [Acetatifactor sp.]|nr:hypothetical protein [Acetatifactor sp.]